VKINVNNKIKINGKTVKAIKKIGRRYALET